MIFNPIHHRAYGWKLCCPRPVVRFGPGPVFMLALPLLTAVAFIIPSPFIPGLIPMAELAMALPPIIPKPGIPPPTGPMPNRRALTLPIPPPPAKPFIPAIIFIGFIPPIPVNPFIPIPIPIMGIFIIGMDAPIMGIWFIDRWNIIAMGFGDGKDVFVGCMNCCCCCCCSRSCSRVFVIFPTRLRVCSR